MRILYLLSREVIILVLAAILIASPIALYSMRKWLQNFAYRVGIHPLLFLMTMLIILSVALLSIGYRSVKVANINPAEAIKYE